MKTVKEVKEVITNHKEELTKIFKVKEIGIFGSYARAEEDNESDVDILVEFEKGHKDFFNYTRLKYYLQQVLGEEIDLVIKGAVKPMLRERIFREVKYV